MHTTDGSPRILRMAILGQSPCQLCHANCCKQNGHEFAVLLMGDEYARFRPFAIDVLIEPPAGELGRRVEKVLPYLVGHCQFLDGDDRCLIYADRPFHCRKFQCIPAFHCGGADVSGHGVFLQRNRDVLKVLEGL